MAPPIRQQPIAQHFEGVVARPLAFTLSLTGAVITDPVITIFNADKTTPYTGVVPGCALVGNDISVTFTSANSSTLGAVNPGRDVAITYDVAAKVDGSSERYSLLAGKISFDHLSTGATSATSEVDVAVTVGETVLIGTIALGGTGGGGEGGAVDSVNGHTGTVVLAATDVGAQPVDGDLTAIAALTPSNDDVIQRKAGAWTNRTIAQLLSDLGLAALYQPLDSDLTAIAALSTTAFGRSVLVAANAAALQTLAGTVIGTNVQAFDAELAAIAGLTSAANKGITFTGSGTAATFDLTAFALTLLDDANAAAVIATLGLGTAATTAATAYATAAQGTTADAALPKLAGGAAVENIGSVEWNVNTVAATGSTEALDVSVYGTHDCTMDQNCTFTFTNPAPSGKESEFKLILRGAFTPTLPAAVKWSAGTPPTYTTPSEYIFSTVDAGTTWLASQVGRAFA